MSNMPTIIIIGIATFLIRFLPATSFIKLPENQKTQKLLQALPPLIFAALIAPSFFHVNTVANVRPWIVMVIPGILTIVAAKYTHSVMISTIIGFGSFLLLNILMV